MSAAHSFTTCDQIEIAYREWGEPTASPPVVLHHGFAAHAHANWVLPGVVDALLAGGRRVIAPDARGHGDSDKPHDPAAYGEPRMARAHASAVHQGGIDLQRISAPTLVLAGDQDPLAVRPEVLVQALADARLELVSGDHMEAVADPRFAASIVEFLA